MSSDGGTADGLVVVFDSRVPVGLENVKAWQLSSEPWDWDFYLYQRAFPGTWGGGMQWWLWYVKKIGCGGCQEGNNMC